MGDKRENMKKALGIPEYPWSSDDDEILGGAELQSAQQRNEPEGRPSVAENPGTSGRQTLSGPGPCIQNTSAREPSHQPIWSLPFISTRRSPTLTLRNREREDVSAVLLSRPQRSQGSMDLQRILAFRKMGRAPAGYRPRAGGSQPAQQRHHALQRLGVGGSRGRGRGPLGSPSAAVSNMFLSMRRIAEEFDNTHHVMRGLNGHDAHMNDASTSMQPMNLSHYDDGFLEPDIHLNENAPQPPEDVRIDMTLDNDNDAPAVSGEPSGSAAVEPGEGAAGGDASALSLEEVVEIDAEPEPAAPPAGQDAGAAQEPVANTSAAGEQAVAVAARGVKRPRESDDESVDLGTVKEFNQSLLRLLECPVCLEWMEPPMWQCRRGHLVCGRCRTRLAACPVCRTAFSSVRNRAMEGVAEMLRYPCRHSCGRDLQLRRRAAHEASCLARRYSCPAPQCASLLAHRDLTQHAQSKHLSLVKLGCAHRFSMRVNSEQHDNWLLLALGQLFHLRVDVDIQTWGVVVYVAYIGPKCNADDYTYEVTVTGQHNSRKLVYTRSTHCDLECPSLNMTRQDCFHLTLDQALNFLRVKNRHAEPDKYLHFRVELTANDPPPAADTPPN